MTTTTTTEARHRINYLTQTKAFRNYNGTRTELTMYQELLKVAKRYADPNWDHYERDRLARCVEETEEQYWLDYEDLVEAAFMAGYDDPDQLEADIELLS